MSDIEEEDDNEHMARPPMYISPSTQYESVDDDDESPDMEQYLYRHGRPRFSDKQPPAHSSYIVDGDEYTESVMREIAEVLTSMTIRVTALNGDTVKVYVVSAHVSPASFDLQIAEQQNNTPPFLMRFYPAYIDLASQKETMRVFLDSRAFAKGYEFSARDLIFQTRAPLLQKRYNDAEKEKLERRLREQEASFRLHHGETDESEGDNDDIFEGVEPLQIVRPIIAPPKEKPKVPTPAGTQVLAGSNETTQTIPEEAKGSYDPKWRETRARKELKKMARMLQTPIVTPPPSPPMLRRTRHVQQEEDAEDMVYPEFPVPSREEIARQHAELNNRRRASLPHARQQPQKRKKYMPS
jgi:hypothetical protein